MTNLAPGTVRVEGLWERFRVYHQRPRGIKDRVLRLERAVYEDLWALRDVGFELPPGATFAVMGANGSGKSTLLKCLARILPPDRGSVGVGGSVASLLELGAGFQADLSGRENIYLNGSILGLKRRRIDALMDDIIDFSGVRDFIDSPVRNFSSGMHVRLGFAIAVHVDPDVILIDEILAVGDAAFQAKCFEAMHDFKRRGKTMVLVTHDLDAAVQLCDRAILLDHGEVLADGRTRETAETYRRLVQERRVGLEGAGANEEAPVHRGSSNGIARLVRAEVVDEDNQPITKVQSEEFATLRMVVQFLEDVEDPNFGMALRAEDGIDVYVANTLWRGMRTGSFKGGTTAEVRFRQRFHLLPGRYRYRCAVSPQDASGHFDSIEGIELLVAGSTGDAGRADLKADISVRIIEGND